MLYMVMLGGKHPKAKIEVHDIVFAVGDSLQATYMSLVQQWFGSPKHVHIDAWMTIDGVEDYAVELKDHKASAGPKLFFVNLGGYLASTFGEDHRYLLVVADDLHSAKLKANTQAPLLWDKPHKDAIFEVDDCLELNQIDGLYVHLVKRKHKGCVFQNDYLVL